MKTLLLTLALPFFLQHLFAQEDSLLKNFKFRNSNYKAVSLNLAGTGQYQNQNLNTGKSKSGSSGGSFGVYYYNMKSTDRILFTAITGLSSGFGFSKSSSGGSETKYKSFSVTPLINISNKWFSKRFFTELGIDASTSLSPNKNTNENPFSEFKHNANDEIVVVTIGIGKGRLENVTDMQNALWLNRVLEKEERLSHSLSADELYGLGRAITAANNTRVLDWRRRTQFILETVDSYLQGKDLINKTDIRYFSNLNDILLFAINEQRLSGTEKFIRVTPALADYYDRDIQRPVNSKNTEKINNKSARLSIGINKYVPVNLHHQNNFGVEAQAFYLRNQYHLKFLESDTVTFENDLKSNFKQAALAAFIEHAIYPNTRTTIGFKLDSRAGYQELGNETGWFGTAILSGSLNYFISYRTTVNCNIGASYNKNVYEIDKYILLKPEIVQVFVNVGLQVNL